MEHYLKILIAAIQCGNISKADEIETYIKDYCNKQTRFQYYSAIGGIILGAILTLITIYLIIN